MKAFTITFLLYSLFHNVHCQNMDSLWVEVSPFDYATPISGSFISENEGWIRHENKIYYTNTGANKFDVICELLDVNEKFIYIQMIDKLKGYAATRLKNDSNSDYIDKFLKTIDGGHNWINITDTNIMGDKYKPIQSYYRTYFIDSSTGFCFGSVKNNNDNYEGIIYKTKNGGETWYKTNTDTINGHLGYGVVRAFFLNNKHGWAACTFGADAGITIFTNDGGENWHIGHTNAPYLFGIHFVDSLKGGTVGSSWSTHVKLTENNFQSLSYNYSSWIGELYQDPMDIHYQNDSTIWVTGYPGYIFRSTNSGKNFHLYQDFSQMGFNFHTIKFFGDIGYIFGDKTLIKLGGNTVSTPNLQIEEQLIKIYPNPANNELIVSTEKLPKGVWQIKIFNIQGQLVYNTLSDYSDKKYFINTSNLANGIYFIHLKNNALQFNQKVIINH